MHLGQISVCDRVSYNIKSDEDKKRILDELDTTFSVRIIQRHHENFCEARHVPIINHNPFLMSVRTNGNPYYLYLTRCDFVDQCILIDKKVQHGYFYPRMILIRLAFRDRLFDNTLFEGEMVRDKNGGWIFLLNDLLVYRNVPQHDANVVRRVDAIYDILTNEFVPDEMDVCSIQVKRYFLCSEINHVLTNFIPYLPYTCRGLYFKPFFFKFRDILLNFDESLIKKIVRTKYKDAGNFLLLSAEGDEVKRGDADVRHPEEATTKPADGFATSPETLPVNPSARAARSNVKTSSSSERDEDGLLRAGTASTRFTVPTPAAASPAAVKNAITESVHASAKHDDGETGAAKFSAPPPILSAASQAEPSQHPVGPKEDESQHHKRTFWARHTNMPDVYELYEDAVSAGRGACSASETCAQLACVPSLAVSRFLRDVFRHLGVTDAVPLICVFSPRFGKWTPVERSPV